MKLTLPSFPFFLFTFLLSLISSGTALCQKLIFKKILPSEGKTFEHVTGIVQDQQGYMWFSSKKGVYKYDGYHMTSYKNNPLNSNSLVSNNVESICIDSNGIIWIGSLGRGLNRLDPLTGQFRHFPHNVKDPSSLSNDTVAALLCDHEGTLWVGTHGGLDRFDPKSDQFIHYRYNSNDPFSISNNQVRSLYQDRQRTLWIGTGSPFIDNGGKPEDGGLNKYNKSNGKFLRYLHNSTDSHSLSNNKVRAIFEDSRGIFWIGTAGDGLHTMDRSRGTFKRYLYDKSHPEKLSRPPMRLENSKVNHITFITEDAAGGIWIGTLGSGMNYYDTKTQKITYYKSTNDSIGDFSDNSSWAAYTSRDGILWISNTTGNLYYVDPLQKKLPYYELNSGRVGSFYQEKGDKLWIATEQGLILNDSLNKTTRRFVNDPLNQSTLSNNIVIRVTADRKGSIWVGTEHGLNLFNKDKQTFTRYQHDPKNTNGLNNNEVISIYEDTKRDFWIGTYMGLNLMNRTTGSFKHYRIDKDTLSFGPNLITCILEDKEGKLWIGAWGQNGVNQFNRETGKFHNYLKGVNIVSIYQDIDGIVWAGGDDGLYQFNHSTKLFSRFIDPSSLTGIPEVLSMMEDNQKNLWMGTTSGIIKLNPQRNETTLYGENYGVSNLVYTSAYKAANGKLFFGDSTGYFTFFPEQITKNARPPEILLTSFRIANKPVEPGTNAPFAGLLWKTKQIKLDHNQAVFSFDFISIDYANPDANRNLFMLENYDNEWRMADKTGRAYYFNVPPGKYIFKIKSSNSYGVWAQKDIDIIITPPWWRTWWVYLIFACTFTGLIWGIIYYRSRSLIKEKNSLEEKVMKRTAEVVKQKEEISIQHDNLKKALNELEATQSQLIQREKMASLGELTAGIAHEIQNPLNFVNNFSEVNTELIDEMQHEIDKGNLEDVKIIANDIKANERKINHHGKRADTIVKGMLQHSRTSTKQKEPTDINALADEYLRLSYHGLRAKDKTFNATMQTDFDQQIGKIMVVSQDIGRVFLNLFNNAFYSVTEKNQSFNPGQVSGVSTYEPTVSVSTKKIDKSDSYRIEIRVKDNGMGIPQKVIDKIYQPFFTTKPAGQGTGLGLSLSYDIIKAHSGEITIATKEGEGAEFIIHLPII